MMDDAEPPLVFKSYSQLPCNKSHKILVLAIAETSGSITNAESWLRV